MRLWIDTETRSSVPLAQGLAPYCTQVEVMIVAWAIDDKPITVEDLTVKPASALLKFAATQAQEIWAHNAEFDRTVLSHTDWWLAIPLERWRCTAALARMHGLPGGLNKLSTIFKLPLDQAKDQRGYFLIRLFCIPRKDGGFNDRHSHPKEWAEFLTYAGQDVTAMRVLHAKCPQWNATPRMWSFWHLDQRMNDRGVAVDLELASGAVKACTEAKAQFAARTAEITDGEVESTTQVARLREYIASYGVDLPDLKADTVERRLDDEALPEHVKELLRIRQEAGKSSIAKYKRALSHHVEGRIRNILVFCGASRTGRWAARGLQLHNFPRPKHPGWDIEHAIERFRRGDIHAYAPGEILGLGSSSLRGLVVAGETRKLVVADLANIEGRFMAWIAGEEWKIDAFRLFDRGLGVDMYRKAYARAFNIDPSEVTDAQRMIGKVMELALQYFGGVGAFVSMAAVYGLSLEYLSESAWPVIPINFKVAAREDYIKALKRKRTYGLDERIWSVCHALVLMWRDAHPAICTFWGELDTAFRAAMHGGEQSVGEHIKVSRVGNWMRVRLPSGRYLNYPGLREDSGYDISFLGVSPYTKQWRRLSTYSGKLAENVVQGGAADILMDGLLMADKYGYEPVLSVHDEAICEPEDDEAFNAKGLAELMTTSSPWADGLPLAAKGFESYRYRKE